MNDCPDCERYKLSASMWRNEAYKHAGVELPWKPEELLRKEYERGFIDGMQKQMQSSVDKAINAMTQPTYYIPNKDDRLWVGLTDEEVESYWDWEDFQCGCGRGTLLDMVRDIEAKLKEKNT